MKKYVSIALTLVLALCLLSLGVNAQAENKLTTSWTSGLAAAVEEKNDADGTKYVSATGIDGAWKSPFINVYDAVKAIVGNEEEVEVMFTFEMRVQYSDADAAGTPITARVIIRPSGLSAGIKDKDTFAETYGNESGMFKNDGGNVMGYFDTSMSTIETTEEWTIFECPALISKSDLNDSFWTGWDLCVDMISEVEILSALEFRNAGVYLYDDYEPAIPVPTEEPVTEEPTEIPAPTEAANTPVGIKPTTVPSATAAGTVNGEAEDGGSMTTIIIVCVVAAVVVIAVVVGIVVAKKKKSGDSPAETNEKNDTQE